MHSALFALFGFATAAYTASIPRAAAPKPLEVSGFNFTMGAQPTDVANVYFYITEPNTGDTTICGDDSVRPNELRFCNGLPQYVFGDNFKTLSVSWTVLPDGSGNQSFNGISGTGDVKLNCVDGDDQCHIDDLKLTTTVVI
ncbi:hypothetical protein SLS54_000039 [Diplodia seriata]